MKIGKLGEFGAAVLEIMEREKEWTAGTMDMIDAEATASGLGASDVDGFFVRATAGKTPRARTKELWRLVEESEADAAYWKRECRKTQEDLRKARQEERKGKR